MGPDSTCGNPSARASACSDAKSANVNVTAVPPSVFVTSVTPPAASIHGGANVTVNGIPTDHVSLINVTKDNLCDFVTKIAPPGWVARDQVFGARAGSCK